MRKNYDQIAPLFVLASTVLWSLCATAQGVFRGQYEISVSWGSSASLITSSYIVTPGQTVEVPIGDDIVAITVLPLSDSEYDLQISHVSAKEGEPEPLTAAHTRRETFGTRSELKDATSGALLPDGATVTVLRLWE